MFHYNFVQGGNFHCKSVQSGAFSVQIGAKW